MRIEYRDKPGVVAEVKSCGEYVKLRYDDGSEVKPNFAGADQGWVWLIAEGRPDLPRDKHPRVRASAEKDLVQLPPINFVDMFKGDNIHDKSIDFYAESHNVTLKSNGLGVCGGNGNGNPGNWGLEGTNGSPVWAIWGSDGDASICFKGKCTVCRFDAISTDSSGVLKVVAHCDGTKLSEQTVEFSGASGKPHVCRDIEVRGPLSRIVLSSKMGGYGVDNIRITLAEQ